MEKKNWITLGVVVVVLIGLFTLCFFVEGDTTSSAAPVDKQETEAATDANDIVSTAERESAAIKDSEMDDLEEINVDDYLEMYTDEDDVELVYVARPTCGYCQIAEPIIKKLEKDYDLDINYLNTDEFSEGDQNDFIASDEMFAEGFGTPMLLLVGKNSIVDSVDGLSDTAGYMDFLEANNLLIED